VFQDSAQVNAVYGRDIAPTIVANHRAKLLLPGIADADTLRYVSTIVGDERDTQISTTDGRRGERSSTRSTGYRSLLPPNALRQMRPGQALLVYGTLPPAKLALRPWFQDRTLRGLAEATPEVTRPPRARRS
jgi:type IV secretory pathway TraG/TraD family ATPase VirD4